MMKMFLKKTAYLFSLLIAVSFGFLSNPQPVLAASITNNYTMSTAYHLGSWDSFDLNAGIIPETEKEAWCKFTVAPGDHIYIRVSSGTDEAGMKIQLKESTGTNIEFSKSNPENLIFSKNGLNSGLYVDVDNFTSLTKSFYIVVERGTNTTPLLSYSVSAGDRIRTGSAAFSFSGLASNPGNVTANPKGVNSSVLTMDLTNDKTLPPNSIVTDVKTSGTQSPNQGNVHHMVKPASSSGWYTSTTDSAARGYYYISIDNNYTANQKWSFQYNALAAGKSTMKSVKVTLKWQYDMKYTDYQIY